MHIATVSAELGNNWFDPQNQCCTLFQIISPSERVFLFKICMLGDATPQDNERESKKQFDWLRDSNGIGILS